MTGSMFGYGLKESRPFSHERLILRLLKLTGPFAKKIVICQTAEQRGVGAYVVPVPLCGPSVSLKTNCVFIAPYVFPVVPRSRAFANLNPLVVYVCLSRCLQPQSELSSEGYLLLIPLNTD